MSVSLPPFSSQAWFGLACSFSSTSLSLLLVEWMTCNGGASNAVDAGHTLRRFRLLSVRPHPLLFFFSGGCWLSLRILPNRMLIWGRWDVSVSFSPLCASVHPLFFSLECKLQNEIALWSPFSLPFSSFPLPGCLFLFSLCAVFPSSLPPGGREGQI